MSGVSDPNRQNMSEFVQVNRKVFYAAADRNKDVILEQLKPILDKSRLVLEVGSGSGQHIYRFSKDYPNVVFQPTEYDSNLLTSIDAYADELNKEGYHINPALELDATNSEHWERVQKVGLQSQDQQHQQKQVNSAATPTIHGVYDLLITTNVFHISPWIVGQSIVRGAGKVLRNGGRLAIYGPFKKDGKFNTESNRQFDETLRGRNPSWGVRDIEEIEAVAKNEADLKLDRIIDMPSNNYMLLFSKVAN
ncbi:hypothetical protein BX616_010899 [Lobosporangium transversale]|uniref:S-adenosyl-L-methionine-dependent methyltransferase n=1 Tax=Lobosporangium transversale TaxID=64571 RepID=A0A1Y2GS68_9FUNG|nr:hypothetical protein BCR41DRAFT_385485 [Lobosporangium transversale]KAF9910283.1 hypothetical protein BX616_010899 [Lobosporangium transversale]ORZ20980.1 hypothetical protein BCR41DRAFT_385485 [Lobosporangium transversale]|eukprot:XP_021882889.1 hypothetical protein BCR41DRAFT_385485 [Lobosporangium transversale]